MSKAAAVPTVGCSGPIPLAALEGPAAARAASTVKQIVPQERPFVILLSFPWIQGIVRFAAEANMNEIGSDLKYV